MNAPTEGRCEACNALFPILEAKINRETNKFACPKCGLHAEVGQLIYRARETCDATTAAARVMHALANDGGKRIKRDENGNWDVVICVKMNTDGLYKYISSGRFEETKP